MSNQSHYYIQNYDTVLHTQEKMGTALKHDLAITTSESIDQSTDWARSDTQKNVVLRDDYSTPVQPGNSPDRKHHLYYTGRGKIAFITTGLCVGVLQLACLYIKLIT